MKKNMKKILSAVIALTMTAGLIGTMYADDEPAATVEIPKTFVEYDLSDEGFETRPSNIADTDGYQWIHWNDTMDAKYKPYKGNGAVSFGDTNTSSIWVYDYPAALNNIPDRHPHEGDIVSGTYWLKVMTDSKEYATDKKIGPIITIRMRVKDESGNITTTDVATVTEADLTKYTPYEWVQLQIPTKNVPITGGEIVGFAYELKKAAGTMPCMIDNIRIGTMRDAKNRVSYAIDNDAYRNFNGNDGGSGLATIITNNPEADTEMQPYSGSKAIFLNETDDTTAGNMYPYYYPQIETAKTDRLPKDGDSFTWGTFRLKILKDKTAYDPNANDRVSPQIKVSLRVSNGDGTYTAKQVASIAYSAIDLTKYDPYEWIEFPFVMTNEPYVADNDGFVVEITQHKQAMPCLIDDIRLGYEREYVPEEESAAFQFLDFETVPMPGSADGTGYQIAYQDPEHPSYKGLGALYLSGGGFSLWGGGGVTISSAEEGSTLSGTVMIKLAQQEYNLVSDEAGGSTWFKFPTITIAKEVDNVPLAVFDGANFKFSELPDHASYTWFEVPIESTGATFLPTDMLKWSVIRNNNGATMMIDSINLKVTPPVDPEIAVSEDSTAEITDGGVSVNVDIINTESATDVTADVYIAVFDDDGKLIGAYYEKDATIDGYGSAASATTNFNPTIEIDEGNVPAKVRVMIWDENQSPLADKADLTITETVTP